MSIENISTLLIENSTKRDDFSPDSTLKAIAIAQTHILERQTEVLHRLAKIELKLMSQED